MLKKLFPYLAEADSKALQSSIRDLDKSFQYKYPKLKSKHSHRESYKIHSNIKIFDNTIQLPKLGPVKCRISRKVNGQILSAIIFQIPSGEYYISICCTDVPIQPKPRTGLSIGLDMGLKVFMTDSNGEKYPNPKYFIKSQCKLTELQRKLSRKPKESHKREKVRIRMAKLHEHIANQRKDNLHKLSTDMINRYDTICIEDLSIQKMAENHHLSKAIMDAAWRKFRTMLEHKAKRNNRNLMVVDRFFPSSQLCSVCNARNPDIKDLSVREWTCPNCGKVHDRDVNAARNILKEGLQMLARSKIGRDAPESASAISPGTLHKVWKQVLISKPGIFQINSPEERQEYCTVSNSV